MLTQSGEAATNCSNPAGPQWLVGLGMDAIQTQWWVSTGGQVWCQQLR